MSPLDEIKNDLTLEVGRTRAILRGLQLFQREETEAVCRSDDLAHLIEIAFQHAVIADELTVRLDQALVDTERDRMEKGMGRIGGGLHPAQ